MLQQNNYNYTACIKTNKLALQSCFCLFVFDKIFGGRCCIIRACHHEAKTTFKSGLIYLYRDKLKLQPELVLAGEGSSVASSGSPLFIGKP